MLVRRWRWTLHRGTSTATTHRLHHWVWVLAKQHRIWVGVLANHHVESRVVDGVLANHHMESRVVDGVLANHHVESRVVDSTKTYRVRVWLRIRGQTAKAAKSATGHAHQGSDQRSG